MSNFQPATLRQAQDIACNLQPRVPSGCLSVCLIVKNEAHTLPDCLASLGDLPDEVIVVDTGSTDNTVEVARRLGAQVHHFAWRDDFAAARNASLRHATGDWILWLDADFELRRGHQERIQAAITSGQADAYFANVRSRLAEGQIEEWGRLPMLWRNRPDIRFEGAVHEQVLPSLRRLGMEPAFTNIVFEHRGYADPTTVRAKAERNLPALLKALAREPNDPLHHYHLGQTYVALNRFREARVAFERVIASAEAPPHMRANAYAAALGVTTGHLADTERAVALAADARREFPDYPFLRYMAGLAQASTRDWQGASADFTHALDCLEAGGASETPEAAGALPRATQFRVVPPGEIQAVLERCQEILEDTRGQEDTETRRHGDTETRSKRSRLLVTPSPPLLVSPSPPHPLSEGELRVSLDQLAEGDVAPAEREEALARIAELEAEAARRPEDAGTLASLGRAYAAAGRYDEAIDVLERALDIDPKVPGGYYALGMCYQLQGDVLAALRAYERQVDIDPQHDPSWNNLGSLYGLHGNHEQALTCFERAAALDPTDESARQNLALARKQLDATPPLVRFGDEIPEHATRNTQYATRNTQHESTVTRQEAKNADWQPTLSVCMIVKNEAHNLPNCLASLGDLPDEVIVVDTGSTDDTVEVARELGAKVYHFAWCDDFAAARNESLRHATGDWILWFDADFRLAPGHTDRIRRAITDGPADAYWLNVRSPFRTEVDARSEWTRLLMLFRNHQGTHFEGAIHEQVKLGPQVRDGEAVYTDIVVHHLGYANPESEFVQGKAHRNLTLLEKRLAEDPSDQHARFQYVQTLSFLRRYEDVLKESQPLLANPRLSSKAHYLTFVFRVQAQLGLDNYKAALADLNEGEKLFPDDRYLKFLAFRAHRKRKDWERAVQTLHQALVCPAQRFDGFYAQEVSHGWLHALLGEAYLNQAQLEQAVTHFQRAAEAGWQSPDTAMRHGRALMLLGDHTSARDVLLQALEHAPAWIEANTLPEPMLAALLGQLVEVCATLDDAQTLLQVGEQGTELMPEAPRVHCAVASVYAQAGDMEEALARYSTALELDPRLPEAHYGKGKIHLREGRLAEAQASLERARDLAPDNPSAGAGQRVAVLNSLGYAYLWQAQAEAAALTFGEAVKLNPEDARSYFNLSLALRRLGQTEDAQFCMETALRLDPNLQKRPGHE